MRLYCSIDTATAWKKFRFILLDISDFHMTDNQSIAIHAFTRRMLTSLSVDYILLPKYGKLSTEFKDLTFRVEMATSRLMHMNSVLSAFK